jgi:rod shape-determining protein MreD
VRRAALALVSLAVLLLQVGLLPALRPFGVVPNLALVWIVLIGLEGSASLALIYAVVIGVSLDVASGASFGLWTGMLVLAALAAGVVHRAGIELTGSLVAAVMVAVGTVLTTVVILGGLVNSITHWPWGLILVRLVMQLVLNLILTVGLRPLARWLVGATDRPVRIG